MTRDQIAEDLTFARNIAAEGAATPLIGGPIGLMWGVLISMTLIVQWAILAKVIAVPATSLYYLWIAFSVSGGLGSMIIGRKIETADGAHSTANRVEKYVWIMFSAMMAALFAGAVLNIALAGGGSGLFGIIVISGFAGMGLAYGVVGLISGTAWIMITSIANFIASIVCFVVSGDVKLYLIGGIAVIFTVIIPSLISMKRAQQNG